LSGVNSHFTSVARLYSFLSHLTPTPMHFSLRALLAVFCVLLCGGISYAQPVANFTGSPLSGCAPLVVTFTDASTGTVTGYSWDFGNSNSSILKNPSAAYASPGTYTVKLTVSGPGGTNTVTKSAYITVYPGPTVSFSAVPVSGCPPLNVQFSSSVTANAPGALTYTWSYGDGNTGINVGANPAHTYTASGSFPVTLSVKNGAGCVTTVPVANFITVFPKPSAAFTAIPTVYCKVPSTANFINSGSTSMLWNFGTGPGTTSGNNPSYTYTNAGTYTVSAFASNSNGCTDTVIKNAYISVQANNSTFSGPATACDSTSVSFSNTSSGVTGFTKWNFGNGGNDTGKNVSFMYTAVGTYTVKMVTQVGPCVDTVTKTIVITPKPIVNITHDIPCLPGNMTFTASTNVPVATYNWSWKSGGSATGNPVTKYYTNCMVDTTLLVVSTSSGCKDTIRVDTTFVPNFIPQVFYNATGCAPRTVTFTCLSLAKTCISCDLPYPGFYAPSTPCIYPFPVVGWTWWVDGVQQASTSGTMSFFMPAPGSHTIILKSVTSNGCQRYDTFGVCGGYKLKPSFYAHPDTVVCVKTPVLFQNTTGDSTISYIWDYGEADSTNFNYHGGHRYGVPGTYSVTLISSICNCRDSFRIENYITVLPSDAHFIDSPYCPPSKTVAFTNTSIGATTDYWDFGDGTTSTLANPPPHTYPAFGKYGVTHITWNSTYGCRDTLVDSLTLIPGSISITTDTTLCLGDTIKLRGSFTGLPVYQPNPKYAKPGYTWYVNGSVVADTTARTNLDTLVSNRGYYSVKWVVRSGASGQCRDSITRSNYIIVSHPVAGFKVSDTLGCTPLSILYTDTTSYTPGTQPLSRYWLFGNSNTATNNTTTSSNIYTAAGKYSIKLKVTDWIGCTDSVTKNQYIEARHPVISFFPDRYTACAGENVNFTNQSTGATGLISQWSFGDGDTSMAFSPYHAYKTAGRYTVRLIVRDSTGCADTLTMPGTIDVTRPKAAFTLSDTIAVCPPLIVTFTSTSINATGYEWSLGNGSTAMIPGPSSTYTNPGVYDIRLIVIDSNLCADTATAKVRVLGYAGALSYTPLSGCLPLTVNFTANLYNVPVIIWDFADGDTALATSTGISHTYTKAGTYVPKLIFYDGKGCSASSVGIDTIKVDDVFAGFKILPPCERTPLMLVDTSHSLFSPLTSWHWEFGPGQIATGQSVQRIYPSAGQYPVTLIVTNKNGCIDTLLKSITINPLPVIKASADTVVCVPDSVTLTATGGISYTWTPAATLSCANCTSPRAAPVSATSYIVTGTDSNGCANKDTVRVGMQTITSFIVTSGGEICLGQSFQLKASGATTYTWTPASSLSHADSSAPLATPTTTTTYVATGREGSCLADTHLVKVVVNPVPKVDAGNDDRVVAGNSVILQASGSGIDRIEWTADSSLSCTTCYAPNAAPKHTTTYYVTAYTNKGCTATDSVTVRVLCNSSQLYIPNTFTPNGDGLNDFFFPRGKGLDVVNSFRVYSRWGELLFERNAMNVNDEYAGWNGTYKSQKLAPDVYVYIIEASCDNGDQIQWKGDVTLIR
jgi:gliding motility-associated-like protein